MNRKPTLLLDSGAYTAYTKGVKLSIDEYAKFIHEEGGMFCGYFNMDVIGNAEKSYDAWKYLKSLGVNAIPVYHNGTPEKYLKMYLQETDYIGFGAIAKLSTKQRIMGLEHIWKKYLLDSSGKPTVKVHGLGLTSLDIMFAFPWYSVDSFTPVVGAAFGAVFLPMKRDGVFVHKTQFLSKISSQGNYMGKQMNSFLSLPKILQRDYTALFEEYGFGIGKLTYQEKKPRRLKKQIVEPMEPLFNLAGAPHEAETLANDWAQRLQWNLVMWNELQNELEANGENVPLMYVGSSTSEILRIIHCVVPLPDVLTSFVYMSKPYLNSVKTKYQKK